MNTNEGGKLSNNYVEKYYDTQVAALGGSYVDDRWHSSPLKEFEYQQTARAIKKAISDRSFKRAVEIGPGDGVWTSMIRERVQGELHLVEQSKEMLAKARERLVALKDVTFEHSDFLSSHPESGNELVIAVRCFEYFEDKVASLKKMRSLLAEGGRIVVVTKNSKLVTQSSVQHKLLHSDQVSPREMKSLALRAGLTVEHVYPAVFRWKAKYASMRFIFDVLHKVAVWSNGLLVIPFFATYATESYVYVMSIDKK